jgi:hypothetical protein
MKTAPRLGGAAVRIRTGTELSTTTKLGESEPSLRLVLIWCHGGAMAAAINPVTFSQVRVLETSTTRLSDKKMLCWRFLTFRYIFFFSLFDQINLV